MYGDLIHSIYLRGSVAKGNAINYISDLDTLALTSRPISDSDKVKQEQINNVICSKYPFITGVEMHFENLSNINERWLQFLLKTQCVCIYREDVIPSLNRFKAGRDAFAHIHTILEDIDIVIKELNEESNSKEIRNTCTWIMKRVLRAGYELVTGKRQIIFQRPISML